MIFLTIIGLVAYFLLPVAFILWLCYDKFDIDLDPEIVGWGTVIVEIALFVQILGWMGVFD